MKRIVTNSALLALAVGAGLTSVAAADKRPVLWKIRRITMNLGIARGQQIAYAEGVAARIAGCERHLQMMAAGELWQLIGPLERTARYKADKP